MSNIDVNIISGEKWQTRWCLLNWYALDQINYENGSEFLTTGFYNMCVPTTLISYIHLGATFITWGQFGAYSIIFETPSKTEASDMDLTPLT